MPRREVTPQIPAAGFFHHSRNGLFATCGIPGFWYNARGPVFEPHRNVALDDSVGWSSFFYSSLFSPEDTLRETTAAGPRFAKEAVMVIVSAKIPRYVLREGLAYASPRVLQPSFKIGLSVLYGFSDKPEYDAFISSSELPLTPYPLVRGYLERAIDSKLLQLVVLDAETSHQTFLQASTFEAVLDSLCNKRDTVPVTHQLMIDKASTAYRVEESTILEGASHASVKG